MRIAAFADPHGNQHGLSAVLREIDAAAPDLVVCAGDLVGYYPAPNEVIEAVRSREIVCVAGNHDCYLTGRLPIAAERWAAYNLDYVSRVIEPEHRAWLADLPTSREIDCGGVAVLLCHGSPWSVDEYVYPDSPLDRFSGVETPIVIMGHTHIPMVRRVSDVLLVNAGSAGQPRDYNPDVSFALVDTEARSAEIARVPYETAVLVEECTEAGFAPGVIEILTRKR